MPEPTNRSLLDEFKPKVIAHSLLVKTRDAAVDLIREPAGKEVALIMGPTGVGKTTLFNRLKSRLLQDCTTEMAENKGVIPIVALQAPAPETGSFNWRGFYIRILKEMHDPAAELDLALSTGGKVSKVSQLSTLNLMSLREMVENAFHQRAVKVLLVDEAQHIQKNTSGRRVSDQMDVLKSVSSMANVFIVLIGTYELIGMVELNGQLARRCASIHFPRYRYDNPHDLEDFKIAIHSFGTTLQREGEKHSLHQNVDLLYRGSVGCIGILKNWLTRALKRAESRNKSIEEADLIATMEPSSALLKLAEEITVGEDHWRRSFAPNAELDERLGMTVAPVASPRPRKAPSQGVGVRNPVRDPIGSHAAFV